MNLEVLVVDDDAVVLFLHKLLIQRSILPSNVKEFPTAEEALLYIKKRTANNHLLIFLDINMPGLNGWDFLAGLEQISLSEKIFVVMVTSSINRSDRDRATAFAHVIDYREKPLSKEVCEDIYYKILPLVQS